MRGSEALAACDVVRGSVGDSDFVDRSARPLLNACPDVDSLHAARRTSPAKAAHATDKRLFTAHIMPDPACLRERRSAVLASQHSAAPHCAKCAVAVDRRALEWAEVLAKACV